MKYLFVILFVGLTTEARKPRPQWRNKITPCTESQQSCDNACRVKETGHHPCDTDTGYCICPVKARPRENCRLPHGRSEFLDCSIHTCEAIKPENSKKKHLTEAEQILILNAGVETKTPVAMICSNTEEAAIHCACFLKKEKASKIAIHDMTIMKDFKSDLEI